MSTIMLTLSAALWPSLSAPLLLLLLLPFVLSCTDAEASAAAAVVVAAAAAAVVSLGGWLALGSGKGNCTYGMSAAAAAGVA